MIKIKMEKKMYQKNAPFDRKLLAQRRNLIISGNKEKTNFLFAIAVDDLRDRLITVNRCFKTSLDLSGHTGLVSRMMMQSSNIINVIRADQYFPDLKSGKPSLVIDEEFLPFCPESFDLVISAMSLHWINDLPGTLVQIRRILRPDGLFLGIFPGGDSLKELRESFLMAETELYGGTSPRVLPFSDTLVLGDLLYRAGFALPVVDKDKFIVRYDSALHLMKDLKSMGATNILRERSRRPATRALLSRAVEYYQDRFSDIDGRVRATFQLISLSGWAPHESQQKPLKPGSAEVSLANVLRPSLNEPS